MNFDYLSILNPDKRQREYLSGGTEWTLSPLQQNALQVLNRYQDDLNKEFSDSAYDEMMRDPAVAASMDILKSLILAEPLRVVNRIQDKKNPDYEQAKAISDFVDKQLNNLKRPLQSILWESLECLQYGSSLVEIIYEEGTYEGKPILALKDLKTRNRLFYALVCDRFFNVLGAVQKEDGSSASIYSGSTEPKPEEIIPREKFLLLTPQIRNGDPRGISFLRPAWNAYYSKSQVYPQYLKYLNQFASPSLVGYTPENQVDEVEQLDAYGNPIINADGSVSTITPEEDMLSTLLGFQSGTVAVLKGGSKLDIIQSQGEANGFTQSFDLFDKQIAMAILKTHRTLLEAKHGSKADAEASADITDVFVSNLREIISSSFSKDVVYQLVAINYGTEIADKFAPYATLKSMPKQDFQKASDSVAKLWTARYLHPSQVAEVDAMIGLPERDIDQFLEEQNMANEMSNLSQMESIKIMNPSVGNQMLNQNPNSLPPEADSSDFSF